MTYSPSPEALDPATLAAARPLDLCRVPATATASALVEDLTARVQSYEAGEDGTRKTKRREAGQAALRLAVGAVAGSLLDAWGGHGAALPAYRSRKKEGFTGGAVGFRMFDGTMGVLLALGLAREVGGKRYETEGWDEGSFLSQGWAARFWPGPALLELAEAHGVIPATVRHDFCLAAPTVAPKVRHPVELRPYEPKGWGANRPAPRMAATMSDPEAARIVADVSDHNDLAATVVVTGCAPPRFKRVFHGAWEMHGRWYAAGSDAVYQTLPQALRGALTINGELVAELDVSAAHLTILRGLCGLPACAGDPYRVEGVSREAAKRYALEALGKGKAVDRWSRRTPPAVRVQDVRALRAAMLERHSCLSDPAAVVPLELAAGLRVPAGELVGAYLAAKEAEAMTEAMRELRTRGVLALPVHDSLIVPASAAQDAQGYIVEAFRRVCGIVPRVEAKATLVAVS